jgi:hypothetical protein
MASVAVMVPVVSAKPLADLRFESRALSHGRARSPERCTWSPFPCTAQVFCFDRIMGDTIGNRGAL